MPSTHKTKNKTELPPIPEKLYFTIGEVAKLCDLKPHVLRYWEQEFNQLSPTKRRGNRRYYQRKEVLLVRQIRSLLYEQGFTIEGARQQLAQENSKPQSSAQVQPQAQAALALTPANHEVIEALEKVVLELTA